MAASADLIVRVITDTSKATGLDDAAGRTGKFKSAMQTAGKVAGAALLGIGAAAISAGKAAAEDAQSQALLANAMKNATGASAAQVASMEDWISKTSMATGVADDQLRPALANLVRATGDVTTSQKAMGIALDVAAATGADVEAVSKGLAKGYAGNTAALGKLVPGLDKAILATGDMDKITAELARTTGGAAADAANTSAGKMKIMTLAFDEAKESLGAALLPAMSKFAEVLAKVAVYVQDNSKAIGIIVGIIAALAVAVLAVNAAFAVYTAVTQVAAAVTWLLNTALFANPLTWVVIGVLALVAAFILLYKNSATVRGAINALWSAIKTGAQAAWQAVKTAFDAILNAIKATFNWVKVNWPLILAIITGPIGLAVLAVVKNWGTIKEATANLILRIREIWAGVAESIGNIVGRIREVWGNAVEAIKGKVGGLAGVLSAPFTSVVNALRTVNEWIWNVISAIGSLISKIAGIKWPSPPGFLSKIPGFGGFAAPAGVTAFGAAPMVQSPGVAGMTRASSTSGGLTINVTGATDPEAVARQIKRILDGHERRIGLAT